MAQPHIFIPKQPLEIPVGFNNDMAIDILRESELTVMPYRMVNSLKTLITITPRWEEWPDKNGGTAYVEDRFVDGGIVETASSDPISGEVTGKFDKDGYPMHEGEFAVLALAARLEDSFGVIWGVMNNPLNEILDPENETHITVVNSSSLADFYQANFGKK